MRPSTFTSLWVPSDENVESRYRVWHCNMYLKLADGKRVCQFIMLCLGFFLFSNNWLTAQHLSFRPVGVDEGMRTTASWHCTIDRFGCIWIATTDGLVRYNGEDVTHYYAQDDPQLPSDRIGFLFVDSRDNLWICTSMGLARMDVNRRIHRQTVIEDSPDRSVQFCMEDSRGYITAISQNQCFQLPVNSSSWHPVPWLDSLIQGNRVRDCQRFDQDIYILTLTGKGALVVNLKSQKQVAYFLMPGTSHAAKLNDRSLILATTAPYSVFTGDLFRQDTLIPLDRPAFFKSGDLKTKVSHLTTAANGLVYMTTHGSGLLRYDPVTKEYHQYLHDPANPYSPVSDNLRYLFSDSLGNIVFTCLSGANFTNVNSNPVLYINYFRTVEGNVYDARVVSIAEDISRQLWVLMEYGIVVLDSNRIIAHDLIFPENSSLFGASMIPYSVTTDQADLIWVAFRDLGIGIFGTDRKLKRLITPADYPSVNIELDRVRIMRSGQDGYMYLGTEDGFFRIHQSTFVPDTFPQDPALWQLKKERIVDVMILDTHWWISSSPGGGAWKYDIKAKTLQKFSSSEGLMTDRVYGLGMDKLGNMFLGSYDGLTILRPDGQMVEMTKGSGLPSTRIESVQNAADGSVWMTNTFNLLRYDPDKKELKRIAGQPGFSRVNFQVLASTSLSSGELVFGTQKGIVIVDTRHAEDLPDQPLQIFVFYKNAQGHEFLCQPEMPIHLTSGDQFVQFVFGVNNIVMANQMTYRYRLISGTDTIWSLPSHISRVDFKLDPGSYQLDVEASDSHAWYSAPGPILLRIDFPWWQRWWVIGLAILSAGAALLFYFRGRINTYRNELAIARQIAELESKALRAQMNPHFVFNCLNAIQECIVTGKVDEAYVYLSKFSKLLRAVLEHSDMSEVSLHDELEVLSLYISLEKLRFMDDLVFELTIDSELDSEVIFVPPMLIQPHLENAIWHGLRHRSGQKILGMRLAEKTPGYLHVIVEDNGIGRVKAAEIRLSRLGKEKHTSKGRLLSHNRLDLLKGAYPQTSMEIVDMYNDVDEATGTRVILEIPMLKSKTVMNPAKV